MARIKINPSTDIKTLKRDLKKRGYVLRVYHPPDGSTRYVVHRNRYLAEGLINGDAAEPLNGANGDAALNGEKRNQKRARRS